MIKITSFELKPTKTGKQRAEAIVSADGGSPVAVTIWGDFPNFANLNVGSEIEAIVVPSKDPKYKPSLKSVLTPPAFIKKARTDIKEAQERKEKMINRAMDRKDASIAYHGSLKNAIEFLAAQNREFSLEEVYSIQEKLLEHWDEYNKDINVDY